MRSITSNSLRMMERSMEFLWVKQAAHLDNIANAETPNYRAKTVTFEEAFDRQLRAASANRYYQMPGAMRRTIENAQWEVRDDGEITRMDDNGVNINEQALEALRTAYQQQYIMQSISSDLTTLGKAING